MMFDRKKFDWDVREDAETLQRYQAIASDPERLSRAKECIQQSVDEGRKALGIPTPPPVPGRRNPATIMRMKDRF